MGSSSFIDVQSVLNQSLKLVSVRVLPLISFQSSMQSVAPTLECDICSLFARFERTANEFVIMKSENL